MSRVSVIITCYNEKEFIKSAISSVINQNLYDRYIKEVIIIDDGSTDGSVDLIKSICKYRDKLKLISQKNKGLAQARNKGLENSTAEYIAFLDGDDVWCRNKIDEQVTKAELIPEAGIIYSNYYTFKDEPFEWDREIKVKRFRYDKENRLEEFFVNDGPIVPSTAMVKKKCFDEVGLFDPILWRAQDTDMWLRIIKKFPIQHIEKPLIGRRVHKNSLGHNIEDKVDYMEYVIDKAAITERSLSKSKHKRKSRMLGSYARQYLYRGDRVKSINYSLLSVLYNYKNSMSMISLLLSILPIPGNIIRKVKNAIVS